MKILVTGAAGFIGFRLVKALVKKGHSLRGLLLPNEGQHELPELGVEIFRGDLTKPASLHGVVQGVDLVFHLATRTLDWGSKKQFEAVMVDGTRNLLNQCKGQVSRFVYCSSLAALGLGRPLAGLKEDAERQVCGIPYCDTKIKAEDLTREFCLGNGMEYTITRPANVFGPGSVWVKELLDAFKRGPFPLINKGRAPSAFVYVDNLVEGMALAGLSPQAAGKVYQFCDDYPITWGEYITTLGSWIGKKPMVSVPFKIAWGLGGFCEAVLTPLGIRPPITRLAVGVMGQDNSVDSSLARQELGWESRVSQEEAMTRIKKWVETNYI